jgi:hypothetical protein
LQNLILPVEWLELLSGQFTEFPTIGNSVNTKHRALQNANTHRVDVLRALAIGVSLGKLSEPTLLCFHHGGLIDSIIRIIAECSVKLKEPLKSSSKRNLPSADDLIDDDDDDGDGDAEQHRFCTCDSEIFFKSKSKSCHDKKSLRKELINQSTLADAVTILTTLCSASSRSASADHSSSIFFLSSIPLLVKHILFSSSGK